MGSILFFETATGCTGNLLRLRGETSSTAATATATDALPFFELLDRVLKLLRNARTSDTNGTTERYRPNNDHSNEQGSHIECEGCTESNLNIRQVCRYLYMLLV